MLVPDNSMADYICHLSMILISNAEVVKSRKSVTKKICLLNLAEPLGIITGKRMSCLMRDERHDDPCRRSYSSS
jgi:hypothetical protein